MKIILNDSCCPWCFVVVVVVCVFSYKRVWDSNGHALCVCFTFTCVTDYIHSPKLRVSTYNLCPWPMWIALLKLKEERIANRVRNNRETKSETLTVAWDISVPQICGDKMSLSSTTLATRTVDGGRRHPEDKCSHSSIILSRWQGHDTWRNARRDSKFIVERRRRAAIYSRHLLSVCLFSCLLLVSLNLSPRCWR